MVLETARRRLERVHREAHPRPAVDLGDPEVPRDRQRPVLADDVQFGQRPRLAHVEIQVLSGIFAAEVNGIRPGSKVRKPCAYELGDMNQ